MRARTGTNVRTIIAAVVVTGCGVLSWASETETRVQPKPTSWLIRNVTILDGTGAPPQAAMDLLIRSGRISAIGPHGTLPVPTGVQAIDATGQFAIPGLIDSHVHLATFEREPRIQDALLRAAFRGGITSVRDMGGNIDELRGIAGRAGAEDSALPRFFYSAVVSGPNTMWFTDERRAFFSRGYAIGESPGVRLVTDASIPSKVIADAKQAGATGLKLYSGLSPSVASSMTSEAHRQGLRVWAHLSVPPGRPNDTVQAGVDAVSHADMFVRELIPAPDRPSEEDREATSRAFADAGADTPALRSLLERMRERRTSLEPTLHIMVSRLEEVRRMQASDERERMLQRYEPLVAFAIRMTRAAHEAGVPIVAGTDNIGRETPNLHAELEILVNQVGLTPAQAIHSATLAAARVLGKADTIGSIAVGKQADLVLLQRDPSKDIRNTSSVVAVLRGGHLHRQ